MEEQHIERLKSFESWLVSQDEITANDFFHIILTCYMRLRTVIPADELFMVLENHLNIAEDHIFNNDLEVEMPDGTTQPFLTAEEGGQEYYEAVFNMPTEVTVPDEWE